MPTPVAYPEGLPGPSSFRFVPRERRGVPAGAGLPDLRARSREPIVDAVASWRYSPAEAAEWEAWYREALRRGLLWFSATLPGAGGWVQRVVRYVGPARARHLAAGIFEVSAPLEIRPGAAPQFYPPEGGVVEIGWANPVQDTAGPSVLRANSGAADFGGMGIGGNLFGGVVGYSGQVVEWSVDQWTPAAGGPSPVIETWDEELGIFRITWISSLVPPEDDFFLSLPADGELVVGATINGVPLVEGERLVAVALFDEMTTYPEIAWGPEPAP